MKKLLLISAVVLLSGCQSTQQNYQIVNTSALLPVIDEKFHYALTDYEKFRKVSLATWSCYVPDEKIDELFFCTDGNEVMYLTSIKSRPNSLPGHNDDHMHLPGSAEDHTHPPGSGQEHTSHDEVTPKTDPERP